MKRVDGENANHSIKIWTLSTCGWCRKTKQLLNDLRVSYDYVDVDLLDLEEKALVKEELRKYNPRTSYPTIVINEESVVGFDKEKILTLLDMSDPNQ